MATFQELVWPPSKGRLGLGDRRRWFVARGGKVWSNVVETGEVEGWGPEMGCFWTVLGCFEAVAKVVETGGDVVETGRRVVKSGRTELKPGEDLGE